MREDIEVQLPYGDVDQYYMTANQSFSPPRYEYDSEAKKIDIYDSVWRAEEIGALPGDEVFFDLYTHPLIQRLVAVEQLTLPRRYSTMPNSTEMPRWDHLWGSVIITRKLIKKAEASGRKFSDQEKIILQLRTFLSDVAHTAFSHLGDWLIQGFGEDENHHDLVLPDLLEFGGINDILRRHNISPEEVLGEHPADWIESPSPELCIDRVDYGVREINRWLDIAGGFSRPLDDFNLDGNRIVMTDHRCAKKFAISFGLLATEHWGHPTHRLQLQLFADLTKGAVIDNGSPILSRFNLKHPADLLLTTDTDIIDSMNQVGTLNHDLHAVMMDIARCQRRIFAWGRQDELASFLREATNENSDNPPQSFIHPLESRGWKGRYTGVKPPNVEFISTDADKPQIEPIPSGLDFFLPPLKARAIDPLYYDEQGQIQRLSETDDEFKKLLSEHRKIQAQAYIARIHLSPDFVSQLTNNIETIRTKWQDRFNQPRVSEETLRAAFQKIGWFAMLGNKTVKDYSAFK